MKTKISLIFGLILLGMTFSAWPVKAESAQTASTASQQPEASFIDTSVFINGQKIDDIENGKIQVSFNIGADSKALNGVKYSLALIKSNAKTRQVFDKKVFDETLDLAPNEQKQIKAVYETPKYLKGTYQLLLGVQNQKSYFLASSVFNGKVVLNGSGQYAELISGKGYLSIQDDSSNKQYGINVSTINIDKEEELVFNGEFANYFKKNTDVYPNFTIYSSSVFGTVVSSQKSDQAISLKAGVKKLLQIPVPKVEKPQAYEVRMDLMDASGQNVSVPVYFSFVVRGESATVQFASLDKDYYQKGEKANLDIIWNHKDSATGTETGYTLEAIIKDSKGNNCSKKSIRSVVQGEGLRFSETVNLSIVSNCLDPEAMVQIKSASGEILDSQTFKVTSKDKNISKTANPIVDNIKSAGENTLFKILGVLAILFIVCMIMIMFKRKKSGSGPVLTIFFTFVLGYALFLSADTANACGKPICRNDYDAGFFRANVGITSSVRDTDGWTLERDGHLLFTVGDELGIFSNVEYRDYYGGFNIKYKIDKVDEDDYIGSTALYEKGYDKGTSYTNECGDGRNASEELTESGEFIITFTITPKADEDYMPNFDAETFSFTFYVDPVSDKDVTLTIGMWEGEEYIGTGKVTSFPKGKPALNCIKNGPLATDVAGNCTSSFVAGTKVKLIGEADPGSIMFAFTGDTGWHPNEMEDENYDFSFYINKDTTDFAKFKKCVPDIDVSDCVTAKCTTDTTESCWDGCKYNTGIAICDSDPIKDCAMTNKTCVPDGQPGCEDDIINTATCKINGIVTSPSTKCGISCSPTSRDCICSGPDGPDVPYSGSPSNVPNKWTEVLP